MLIRNRSALLVRGGLMMVVMVLLLGVTTLSNVRTSQAQNGARDKVDTAEGTITPRVPQEGDRLESTLTPKQLRKLQKRHLKSREAVAAKVDAQAGPAGVESAAVAETSSAGAPEAAGDLVIASNNIAGFAIAGGGQFISTLGEPAVANLGKDVIYTGNTFAQYSSNEGTSWVQRNFPSALNAGETVCCDQDLEIDQGRSRVFWSLLYLNGTGTHATVTVGVMVSPTSAPYCLYDFDLGANRVPDYPHIGLSNDFLYINFNVIDTKGTAATGDDTWVNSQLRRLNLDQMVACTTAATNTFTYGPPTYTSQRVFVPVEGAEDAMYWGVLDNTTTFRLFEWKETSTSVTSTTRTVTAGTYANPDCRGGANNTDFIEKSTAWKITGFRMRGWVGRPQKGGTKDVVGFLWNVGADASHTQGHIHGATFDVDTKDLVSQPHIFNNSFCFGFPDVAATERGHPAVILAFGGKNGGGGSAVSNGVLLGDDMAVGGGPFGNFTTIASGTHNPSDSRYGDYLTIQQHEPCDVFMVAAGYALVNGAASANVEHHYVQFGRGRDQNCWNYWHAQP